MVYKRKKKKTTTAKKTKKSEPKEKLIFNKDKWIIGSAQIKKYKESLGIKVCPVTKLPFGTGMDVDCLDHAIVVEKCAGCFLERLTSGLAESNFTPENY